MKKEVIEHQEEIRERIRFLRSPMHPKWNSVEELFQSLTIWQLQINGAPIAGDFLDMCFHILKFFRTYDPTDKLGVRTIAVRIYGDAGSLPDRGCTPARGFLLRNAPQDP